MYCSVTSCSDQIKGASYFMGNKYTFHVSLQSDPGVKLYHCWLNMLLVYFSLSDSGAELN